MKIWSYMYQCMYGIRYMYPLICHFLFLASLSLFFPLVVGVWDTGVQGDSLSVGVCHL